MKALLIKAETMETTVVDLIEDEDTGSSEQIHKLLSVSGVDYAYRTIENKEYYFIVDDYGLRNEDYIVCAWSPSRDSVLAGDLIVSKTNVIGKTVSLNDDDIKRIERNINEVTFRSGEKKKVLFLD